MNIEIKNKSIKILAVIADQTLHTDLTARLKQDNFQVHPATSLQDALEIIRNQEIDLIVIDQSQLNKTESQLSEQLTTCQPWLEMIVVTGDHTTDKIPDNLKAKIFDFIHLPLNEDTLRIKIRNVLERKLYREKLTQYRSEIAMNYGFDNIVGISPVISKLRDTIIRVAPTEISILITGASGTGKELFARTIHYHSRRRNRQFVAMDFSSIPGNLIDSELFGNPDPSTGQPQTGLLKQADGGTLFLDNISHMPLSVQNRFLKFLENFELIHPDTKTTTKLDLRIIAATGRNLVEMINQKKFLEDLYYRLNVIPLNIPTLAERTEDIEMLAEYFLRKTAAETGKPSLTLTRNALEKLHQHHWSGNVRELENTLKRGATFCNDNTIDMDDIIFISGDKTPQDIERPASRTSLTLKGGTLDKSQRSLIIKALNDNDWNYTKTAAELGIGRTTLWRKIKKYNLKKEYLQEV